MEKLIEEAVIFSVAKVGYANIRQHQKDVLVNALSGKDCLFVAPSGSGKSLIFEALPFGLQYIRERKEKSLVHATVLVVTS